MTTIAPKISDNFTIMHQFITEPPDPEAGPDQFKTILDQVGMDQLIDALDTPEPGSNGVVSGSAGSDMEFFAYTYLSPHGLLNVWMSAFRDRTFESGLIATARFHWTIPNQTPEMENQHSEYVNRIREIEARTGRQN